MPVSVGVGLGGLPGVGVREAGRGRVSSARVVQQIETNHGIVKTLSNVQKLETSLERSVNDNSLKVGRLKSNPNKSKSPDDPVNWYDSNTVGSSTAGDFSLMKDNASGDDDLEPSDKVDSGKKVKKKKVDIEPEDDPSDGGSSDSSEPFSDSESSHSEGDESDLDIMREDKSKRYKKVEMLLDPKKFNRRSSIVSN